MNINLTDETLVRQISHIADQMRQDPEQIITRALELYFRQSYGGTVPNGSEQAEAYNTSGELQEEFPDRSEQVTETEASDFEWFQSVIDYKEEAGPTDLEAMMDKTLSIIKYITDNADTIMGKLKPGWDSGLLEVADRLVKKIDAAQSETDLVEIANVVYDLTLGVPHFPPDDFPPEHFRLKEPMKQGNSNHIGKHKAALQKVSGPFLKRIENAWDDLPSIIPPHASMGAKETPWHLMGIFKDDPTWLEIEKERDRDVIWLGGEPE